jgi:ubiquinone/menaquinone biosynthesis C-methylase UbiE
VFGVEPDRIGNETSVTSLRIASKRLDPSPFAAAVGEQLPFAGVTFDLVVMDQVIEHVADQHKVLAEAWRVLKPGGAMYVACPNYLGFYETHYKVWFLPLLPKVLGNLYLRLRRRDSVLLNHSPTPPTGGFESYSRSRDVRRLQDMNEADFLAKFRGEG